MPAELSVSWGTLEAFLLVLARMAGVFTFVPLPGIARGSDAVRIVLALAFTVALLPVWPHPAEAPGAGTFLVWIAAEAAFGVAAGLAVGFLLEAVSVGFQVLGLQAGYSYASTVDPTTQADSSVLLVLAQLLSGLLFFAFGLDREVLRIFAASLTARPPGQFTLGPGGAEAILALGGTMLSTGMRLAMPVVVLLLLVDFALALLGRLHQQMQLLSLAFPAKMLGALALLAAVLAVFLPVYAESARRTLAALERIL